MYVASIATAFFPALHISLYHFNILVLLTWDGLLATLLDDAIHQRDPDRLLENLF